MEIPLGQVDELEGEIVHSRALFADFAHEVVVEDQRGNGGGQPRRSIDEGLGDSGRDGRDRR